ncbi:GTPase [Tropicibacter naphthalenivorans]|uniref:Putative GTPase n=1 Tax=Tropicibacter naphthalenivorans TaxID=441103 RepID=A0A0P1GLK3_9RHOB|nr:GTPase [Tropicibacter naphthalenivorans]CUH75575.1 putative GTPase [Tropicibacter naphthalenivorans]SMC43447.1 50S ribosome-binding GTPase [Tropicibacter naphthalenivorans]
MSRPTQRPAAAPLRRPRLLIAGEFSAGKTKLINGLLGDAHALPSNVTATALPPVWLVGGGDARLVVDLQGTARRAETLEGLDLNDTHYCVVSHSAACLKHFDIIDTPGTSDPNMPPESWERMLPLADAVVWCTNATQAWRQSEKAIWQDMPAALRRNATLVITHADRLPDERSVEKVLRRVNRDAAPFFDRVSIASLINPHDVARIGRDLITLAGAMTDLPGAENALASSLSAAPQPAPTHGAQAITPQRVRPGGTVVPLPRPQKGRARSLWDRLSKNTDLADAAAVLAQVETLIETLDRGAPAAPTRVRRGAGEED